MKNVFLALIMVVLFAGIGSAQTFEATGSCCDSYGVCTIETHQDCNAAEGWFEGDNTTCDPSPCLGACCISDSGADYPGWYTYCRMTPEQWCIDLDVDPRYVAYWDDNDVCAWENCRYESE